MEGNYFKPLALRVRDTSLKRWIKIIGGGGKESATPCQAMVWRALHATPFGCPASAQLQAATGLCLPSRLSEGLLPTWEAVLCLLGFPLCLELLSPPQEHNAASPASFKCGNFERCTLCTMLWAIGTWLDLWHLDRRHCTFPPPLSLCQPPPPHSSVSVISLKS